METLKRLSGGLASHASLFIIVVAVITFFVPSLFKWVHGNTQTVILGLIMLTMGLTLTTQDFKIVLHRPLDIFVGAVAQFVIMPGVAWLLVHVWHLEPALALGILLVGCCPGGVSSNIMSYLCKGDVAFSVGMTTASTLLAPVVTPLLVLWLAGEKVEVDALGMFRNILLVTLLPVTIGFFCNLFMGKNDAFRKAQSVMPAFSVIGLACIVGGVVSAVHDKLLMEGMTFFFIVLTVVFFHNGLGYILGYSVGKMFHFSAAKNRTISIEVGMQNAGLATVLASEFFIVSCPLAVIPCAVSCAWHSISGTIMAQILAPTEKA